MVTTDTSSDSGKNERHMATTTSDWAGTFLAWIEATYLQSVWGKRNRCREQHVHKKGAGEYGCYIDDPDSYAG